MVPLYYRLVERRCKYCSLQCGGAAQEYMLDFKVDDDTRISYGGGIIFIIIVVNKHFSSLPLSLCVCVSLSYSYSDEYRGGDWAVVGSYQTDLIFVAMAMLVKFLIAKVMIMHLIVLLEGSDGFCTPVELLHAQEISSTPTLQSDRGAWPRY